MRLVRDLTTITRHQIEQRAHDPPIPRANHVPMNTYPCHYPTVTSRYNEAERAWWGRTLTWRVGQWPR